MAQVAQLAGVLFDGEQTVAIVRFQQRYIAKEDYFLAAAQGVTSDGLLILVADHEPVFVGKIVFVLNTDEKEIFEHAAHLQGLSAQDVLFSEHIFDASMLILFSLLAQLYVEPSFRWTCFSRFSLLESLDGIQNTILLSFFCVLWTAFPHFLQNRLLYYRLIERE
jgi:hypothetical protein